MARTCGKTALLAVLGLVLLGVRTAQAGGCPDCKHGKEGEAVCGEDGITYSARCLAECQDVGVAHAGACHTGDEAHFDHSSSALARTANSADDGDSISNQDMKRFKEEGFRLTGKGKVGAAIKAQMPMVFNSPGPRVERSEGTSKKPASNLAVRFVYGSGLMYVKPLSARLTSAADIQAAAHSLDPGNATVMPTSGSKATAAGNAHDDLSLGRKLRFVFGSDDRVQVRPTTSYPWSSIGQLIPVGCTAAFINANTLLTAAHCVHGGAGSGFYQGLQFISGRDGNTAPFGVTPVLWSIIYRDWANSQQALEYDMAVIRLTKSLNVGSLRLMPSDTFPTVTLHTAGYPGDKPVGTMWQTTCPASDNNAADQITATSCDAVGGQSGSPVWEQRSNELGLRGILSFVSCQGTCCDPGPDTGNECHCCSGPTYTGFQQLTTQRCTDAMNWAGQP